MLIDSTGLQVFGAGQWLEEKHGAKSRRTWCKLHLAVDADTGMIVAQILTDQQTDDPSQVGPLLAQVEEEIEKVTADGAYDGAPTYHTIAQHGDSIEVVIPPRKTAVLGTESSSQNQRDRHLEMINTEGHLPGKKPLVMVSVRWSKRPWVAINRSSVLACVRADLKHNKPRLPSESLC